MREQTEEDAEAATADPHGVTEARSAGAGPMPAQAELESLQAELSEARREAAESRDKYLRVHAEMDNFKKRLERTYADLARTSKKDLLRKLLGVKDNLERALQYAGGDTGESVIEGVRLTQYQLEQLLEAEGVKVIDAEGNLFDPRLAEAVQSVTNPNVPDQTVVQVVRPGYTYQDEVLRPAQVIVSVHDAS